MAKNSIDAYGASGKSNVLFFNPDALHLVDDVNHPLYDERIHLPIDDAMVRNIADQGVLEPIIVWKDRETGKVCVVDGRQRVRHTREANTLLTAEGKDVLLIPGVVRQGSAVRMSQAMVSANEIRRADTPLGRAKKMASMIERGHDEDDLALLFGVGTQTVRATLALLECTQAVQDAVESGAVNVSQARQLATMPPEEQRETVKALADAGTGVKGHERARRQREVLASKDPASAKPRMKTRKEIMAALGAGSGFGGGPYAEALRWVLGLEAPPAPDHAEPEQQETATEENGTEPACKQVWVLNAGRNGLVCAKCGQFKR